MGSYDLHVLDEVRSRFVNSSVTFTSFIPKPMEGIILNQLHRSWIFFVQERLDVSDVFELILVCVFTGLGFSVVCELAGQAGRQQRRKFLDEIFFVIALMLLKCLMMVLRIICFGRVQSGVNHGNFWLMLISHLYWSLSRC